MVSGEGKQETNLFFKAISSKMVVKEAAEEIVPSGASVLQNAWIFGYMPQHSTVGITPYGIGMLKVFAMGQVRVAVVAVQQYLEYLNQLGGGEDAKHTVDSVRTKFLNAPAEEVASMITGGCKVYVCNLRPYQILYVPCGHLVAECAAAGTLFYGVRKSMMHVTEAGVANMKPLSALFAAAGKPTSKTDLLIQNMTTALLKEKVMRWPRDVRAATDPLPIHPHISRNPDSSDQPPIHPPKHVHPHRPHHRLTPTSYLFRSTTHSAIQTCAPAGADEWSLQLQPERI